MTCAPRPQDHIGELKPTQLAAMRQARRAERVYPGGGRTVDEALCEALTGASLAAACAAGGADVAWLRRYVPDVTYANNASACVVLAVTPGRAAGGVRAYVVRDETGGVAPTSAREVAAGRDIQDALNAALAHGEQALTLDDALDHIAARKQAVWGVLLRPVGEFDNGFVRNIVRDLFHRGLFGTAGQVLARETRIGIALGAAREVGGPNAAPLIARVMRSLELRDFAGWERSDEGVVRRASRSDSHARPQGRQGRQDSHRRGRGDACRRARDAVRGGRRCRRTRSGDAGRREEVRRVARPTSARR